MRWKWSRTTFKYTDKDSRDLSYTRWNADETISKFKDEPVLVQAVFNSPPSEEAKETGIFIGELKSDWVVSESPHKWLFSDHQLKLRLNIAVNLLAVNITNITSDEILTWNQICELLANAAGVKPKIIHIPSEFINRYDKEWGDGLLGDKAHCLIFDNSKIKGVNPDYQAAISFREGVKEILSWYQEDPARQIVNDRKNSIMDKIIEEYQKGFKT